MHTTIDRQQPAVRLYELAGQARQAAAAADPDGSAVRDVHRLESAAALAETVAGRLAMRTVLGHGDPYLAGLRSAAQLLISEMGPPPTTQGHLRRLALTLHLTVVAAIDGDLDHPAWPLFAHVWAEMPREVPA